jgi:hypothetical protein
MYRNLQKALKTHNSANRLEIKDQILSDTVM